MGVTAAVIGAVASVAGAGYAIYSGERNAKEMKRQAELNKPPPPSQEAKVPEVSLFRRRNQQAMASPTLLTGPGGVQSPGATGSTLLGS